MYERILVGTDGSETAAVAVEAAARLARTHDAELVVAHAYPTRLTPAQQRAWSEAPEEVRWKLSCGTIAENLVRAEVERAKAEAGSEILVQGRSEPGRPVPVLVGLIDELDPDAVVVGNRDMAGPMGSYRSVGRAIAAKATCDVIIVDTVGRRDQRRRGTLGPVVGIAIPGRAT